MNNNQYNWTTIFREEDSLMIHFFSSRIKVATNLLNNTTKVFKDDEVILYIDDMHISEYENFLLKIAYKTQSL